MEQFALPHTRQTLASTLSAPLPDVIARLIAAGEISEAIASIDLFLSENLPLMLRNRLLLERERLETLMREYPFDAQGALEEMRRYYPDTSEEDFRKLELRGMIDFLFLNHEKRYFVRFARSLARDNRYRRELELSIDPASPALDEMVGKIREKGALGYRITLQSDISPATEGFTPGHYRFWLPFPVPYAQQSEIALLEGSPDLIAPEDALTRTAYAARFLTAPETFSIRYSYLSVIRYADPLHAQPPTAPLYPTEPPVCAADLAEDHVQIRFTPFLRSLAQEIAGDAVTPLDKAWRVYRYVTEQISYAFVRDYRLLDHLAEYCARNRRGDCGLQALLFITLCRILGVPARWQSGLSFDDRDPGSHDWAQFYLEGWGWLFADCSYGGSAFRAGNTIRHAFFFGNLDPLRMASTRQFMADFIPASRSVRRDPYDNQTGEMECEEDSKADYRCIRHVNLTQFEEVEV
ncbi:MAG: transglutaminase domain-containing protein [Clostridia bacterium]|nr:transglutaminase domain-containing protein [Clostridia bacterium]